MKSSKAIWLAVICIILAHTARAHAATKTIATFGDPAVDGTTPLFEINLTSNTITGGWDDSQTGLDLDVVYSGHMFHDAFFTMTPVNYTGDMTGGVTGSGIIQFRSDGEGSGTAPIDPLIQIEFNSANISLNGLGAVELFEAGNVTITGREITGLLTSESFSFSFANHALLPVDDGYTATAAFTSSAVPEPATILLFGMGGLIMAFARKRRPVTVSKTGRPYRGTRNG
ncbi:MAG: PEP-CTERM sorting domain-containing protein [Planctomycetota bacterium]|jgi:hypothetical protein